MANTIYRGPAEEKPDVQELPAAAAITPGGIIIKSSGTFTPAGADTSELAYVALENNMCEITEDYAADDTVQGARLKSGQYYYMILAASQTIEVDDELTTDASGHLVALGAGDNVIVYANEAVTTTGSTSYITAYVK